MGVVFNTKRDAEKFAARRRKGFRGLIKAAEKDGYYKSSPKRLKARQKFLKQSIKTVKVKRVKHRHWNKPYYEVTGR